VLIGTWRYIQAMQYLFQQNEPIQQIIQEQWELGWWQLYYSTLTIQRKMACHQFNPKIKTNYLCGCPAYLYHPKPTFASSQWHSEQQDTLGSTCSPNFLWCQQGSQSQQLLQYKNLKAIMVKPHLNKCRGGFMGDCVCRPQKLFCYPLMTV